MSRPARWRLFQSWSVRYAGPVECPERDRLQREHTQALLEWTELDGFDPAKAKDPFVIAASAKVKKAASDVLDHMIFHGC
jgi:hypothetical protein